MTEAKMGCLQKKPPSPDSGGGGLIDRGLENLLLGFFQLFGDLAGLEARRADPQPLGYTVDGSLNRLQIGKPAP